VHKVVYPAFFYRIIELRLRMRSVGEHFVLEIPPFAVYSQAALPRGSSSFEKIYQIHFRPIIGLCDCLVCLLMMLEKPLPSIW
jgi:hypothetical protein